VHDPQNAPQYVINFLISSISVIFYSLDFLTIFINTSKLPQCGFEVFNDLYISVIFIKSQQSTPSVYSF